MSLITFIDHQLKIKKLRLIQLISVFLTRFMHKLKNSGHKTGLGDFSRKCVQDVHTL